MQHVFHLPDMGDGRTEHVIGPWRVKEGDWVKVNQPVTEVELEKATEELTSPFAGRIVKIHVTEGQVVPVGAPLVTFETMEDPADIED